MSPEIRPLSEYELNDYLAACAEATDEELLDVKAADGASLRDILREANRGVVTLDESWTVSGPIVDPAYDIDAPGVWSGLLPRFDSTECYACLKNWAHKLVPVHVIVPEPSAGDRALVQDILDRKAEQ